MVVVVAIDSYGRCGRCGRYLLVTTDFVAV